MALRVLLHGVFALALMWGAYWPLWSSDSVVTEEQRAAADPLSPLAGSPPRVAGVYATDLPTGEGEFAEQKPLIYRISLKHFHDVR